MLLKIAIITLFVLLLISLFSSLYFLYQDKGAANKKRALHSLGVRVTLAGAMMALIAYGYYTGEIKSKAPWDAKLAAPQAVTN